MSFTLLFDIGGDYFAKRWSTLPNFYNSFIVVLFYSISGILWGLSLRYEYLSKGTVIINILNVLVMVVLGVVIFKEDLTVFNKIGIGLGVVSLILLSR